MNRSVKLLAVALAMGMVGCATRLEGAYSPKGKNLGQAPVYAKLEKMPSGYRFTKLAFAQPSAKEPWVSLNTLTPVFETKTEANCFIGTGILLGPDKSNECKTADEILFRGTSMGAFQAAAKGLTTVVTYGMTGTSRMVDVVFDREAYDAAVSQAEASLGISREDVLNVVDSEVMSIAEMNAAYKADGARIQIKPSVTDESGFFAPGDVNFKEQVLVRSASMPGIETTDVIPIDASLTREKLLAKLGQIASKADQALLSTYPVLCQESLRHGYRFSLKCPANVVRQKGKAVELPVQVTVKARDFKDVRPKSFSAEDKRLRISLNGDRIVIVNLVQSYIKVDAVSVYYQSKISTKQGEAISLPPMAENDSLRFAAFSHLLPSFDRRGVTKQAVKAKTLQFGLAVKYTVQGGGEFTLFKEQIFPELDLLVSPDGPG